jgi:hypothetical protein
MRMLLHPPRDDLQRVVRKVDDLDPLLTTRYSLLSLCHHGVGGLAIGSVPRYSSARQVPPPSSFWKMQQQEPRKGPVAQR